MIELARAPDCSAAKRAYVKARIAMTVFNVWPIERVVLFGVHLTSAASFLARPILPVETKRREKERRFTTLSRPFARGSFLLVSSCFLRRCSTRVNYRALVFINSSNAALNRERSHHEKSRERYSATFSQDVRSVRSSCIFSEIIEAEVIERD